MGVGRAIVDVHCDDEEDDVYDNNGGHQPGEPFLGWYVSRRRVVVGGRPLRIRVWSPSHRNLAGDINGS